VSVISKVLFFLELLFRIGRLQPNQNPGQQTRKCRLSVLCLLNSSLADSKQSSEPTSSTSQTPFTAPVDMTTSLSSDTTHFLAAGGVISEQPLIDPYLTHALDACTNSSSRSTLKDVLGRPYLIDSGVITAAQENIHRSDWPDELLNQTNFRNKVYGFSGMRGKIQFTLITTAQPEVCGILMLHYYPMAQYLTNKDDAVNLSRTGRTGCPNVKLDVSSATQADMIMDVVSPHTAYGLTTAQGSFGRLHLTVYGSLNDTSGSGIGWQLYATLLEGELLQPTNAPIADYGPRSAPSATDYDLDPETYDSIAASLPPLPSDSPPSCSAQIGDEALTDLVQVAKATSTIAEKAGKYAPLIGLCKPSTQQLPQICKMRSALNLVNVDGVDTGVQLGPSVGTELSDVPGMFGSAEDDMLIKNMISRPEYIGSFDYSASDTTLNKQIATFYVSPTDCASDVRSTSTPGLLECNPTHLFALARCFSMWRGSLVYTFRAVKNAFHKGRLRVAWTPNYIGGVFQSFEMTHNVVWDLSSNKPLEFTVPYSSTRPWKRCGALTGDLAWNHLNGVLRVTTLDRLRGSTASPSTISILVEVHAGPDFEFCNPTLPRNISFILPNSNTVVAQVGTDPIADAGAPIRHFSMASKLTHGEPSPSIRTLIKMFCLTEEFDLPFDKVVFIEPWIFRTYRYGQHSIGSELRGMTPLVDFFSYFFAFYRGGRRFKADVISPRVRAYIIRNHNPTQHAPASRYDKVTTKPYFVQHPCTLFFPADEGLTEFTIPGSGLSHIYPTICGDSVVTEGGTTVNPSVRAHQTGLSPSTAVVFFPYSNDRRTTRCTFFESASDDFGFGCLVGLPRCSFSND
jgi:hypothetical protein